MTAIALTLIVWPIAIALAWLFFAGADERKGRAAKSAPEPYYPPGSDPTDQ